MILIYFTEFMVCVICEENIAKWWVDPTVVSRASNPYEIFNATYFNLKYKKANFNGQKIFCLLLLFSCTSMIEIVQPDNCRVL